MNQTQKHTHGKKLLALLLALVMMVSLLPMSAFATELDTEPVPAVTQSAEDVQEPATGDAAPAAAPADEPAAPDKTAEDADEPGEELAPADEPAPVEDEQPAPRAADVAVAAETGKTVVIACSDFQNKYGDNAGATAVQGILNKMKESHPTANGFLFAGDYYINYPHTDTELNTHLNVLKNAVEGVYGTGLHEVYVQGNHDQVSYTSSGNGLSPKGKNDADDYGVYVIHEDDYMWASDANYSSTTYSGKGAKEIVQQTADDLESYLNEKIEAKHTKPIFVVSHLPLHYSMRTCNDGDGMYANCIFDVLNKAGAAGLNIIFMFGHNHSNGWDDYLGGSCIYLAKGDKINIAQASKTNFKEETLNFTYMNAGYVGYYENNNTGSETTLTMTVFEIGDDKVEVSRYDANGKHDLKSAGVANTYKKESGYDPDTRVKDSPQTITLNKDFSETPVETPTKVENVTLMVGETKTFEGVTADEKAYITDNNKYIATADVAKGEATQTVERVTSIESGKKYLILNTRSRKLLTSATSGNGLKLESGSLSADNNYWWTITGSNNSYTVRYHGDGNYLNIGDARASLSTSQSLTLSYNNAGYWTISQTTGRNTYYLNHYGGASSTTAAGYTTGGNDEGSRWELYKIKDGDPTTALTITGTGAGTTSVVVGDTTYNITVTTPELTRQRSIKVGGSFTLDGVGSAITSGGELVAIEDDKVVGKAAGTATVTSVVKNEGGNVTAMYTYNVTVKEIKQGTDYPEYPYPGSVRVNKTGTGVDFQNTGVAKVELSTTGVPMNAGVDVIVMLDTSSSMKYGLSTNSNASAGSQRIDYLRAALSEMLESFNTADSTTGEMPDIRVAIADFNNYCSDTNSPIYNDTSDKLTGGNNRGGELQPPAQVFTGDKTYGAGAFVDAKDLANFNTSQITVKNGTNYDAAFYYTYQLGAAITAKNAEDGVERDLYVVFMSDGAPYQYNFFTGYSGDTGNADWNQWLIGSFDTTEDIPAETSNHKYFYNTDQNKHWWAEAIKGDPNSDYTVIDKTTTEAYGGNQYMKQVNGLGATMYSIGFALLDDSTVTVDTMENVLKKVATSDSYYFMANNADQLGDAFTQIASRIKMAGKDAVFTDVMGAAYDLQMTPITKVDGTRVGNPTITVSSYELYKRSEVNDTTITMEMVGTRKNPNSPTVLETVTFNDAGTEAYSNLIGGGTTNILTDGAIKAVNFTYDITKETFTWNVGNITEDELVLTYYVYLTGSMEGTRAAGSYPTNESAVLTYTNWLGNNAKKDTVSPEMAWKSATVSYAYYLVNVKGEPIVNQTTGETGSIVNAVKVTSPVVYSTLLLNSTTTINAELAANDVLPAGYILYDKAAAYSITVNSGDAKGSWTITKKEDVATTYVTGYGETGQYNNTLKVSENSYDYTRTTVYFAVQYQVSCIPDSVVIDFGLPVDISVLANDILGQKAALTGLARSYAEDGEQGTLEMNSTFSTTALALTHGTAAINGEKVRYTPRDMKMNSVDTFAYAAQAAATNDNKFYYTTVTVIPAANIYYEDSFVTFTPGTGTAATGEWTTAGTTVDATQAEDRPGKTSLPAYDANNVYGYDAAYKECATYSLGSAQKVTVNGSMVENWNDATCAWPTASFTFTGTGFDIISLTDNDSGTIFVEVKNQAGNTVKNLVVDNYYGYTKNEQGNWVVDEKSTDCLYQIPVMKVTDLEYGTYSVTIKVAYNGLFDHTGEGSYSFWMDAVRVYDPAGKTPAGTIGDAYKADGEAYADVIELRNLLIEANTLAVDGKEEGIVFIDGVSIAGLTDYTNYGPNNEVYLATNQAIAFKLTGDNSKIASIQLGVKAPAGDAIAKVTDNGTPTAINTATEMYYDITHRVTWKNDSEDTSNVIVITNTGDNILSLTNLKVTYKENPDATATTLVDEQVVEEAPVMLMRMLGYEAPAPVEPEVFAPERFEASWNRDTVRAGQKATLTVKTSEDVAYVEVDGQIIDTYRTRTQRTGWGANATTVTYRQFTYTITAAETADYTVTAFNADDVASESITTTLTVQAASQSSGLVGWLESIFGRWF